MMKTQKSCRADWSTPGKIVITPVHTPVPKVAMAIAAGLLIMWVMVGCGVYTLVVTMVQ